MTTNTNPETAINTTAITATLWAAIAGFVRPDAITDWGVRHVAPASDDVVAMVDVSGPDGWRRPDDMDDVVADIRWVLNTHTDVPAGCRWYAMDTTDTRQIRIRFVCLTDTAAAEEGLYPW